MGVTFSSPSCLRISHGYIQLRLPSWIPLFKYKPLASECRELGQGMKNERLDFVRNSIAWSGPHSEILSPLTDRQRNGTAVPSLASEYL